MKLEDYLLPKPPPEEQAMFYRLLKTAAAPVEAPASPGDFTIPLPELLKLMGTMVQNEFKTMYAYLAYANALRDMSHHSVAEEFEDHAGDEREHADWLMRRMSVLGGPMNLSEIPPPQAYTTPVDIVNDMIEIERIGLELWKQLHAAVGEDPMKFQIESYMVQEQEHSDELKQLLPPPPAVDVSTLLPEIKKAGLAGKAERAADALISAKNKITGVPKAIAKDLKDTGYHVRRAFGRTTPVEDLARTVRKGVEKGKEVAGKAGKSLENATGNLRTAVKENPGAALAVGGAGALAAHQAGKASGLESKMAAADPETRGHERARANAAARADTHRSSRGERYGDVAGRLLGGAAALAGASKGKHSGLTKAVAAGVGQHVGGKAGRLAGQEVDARRKHAADGSFDVNPGMSAAQPSNPADPTTDPDAMMTYIRQEGVAQRAELEAHNQYNQQRADAAEEQARQLQQQSQQLQQQAQQAQQQLDATNAQLQAAQGAAMTANNSASQAMMQAISSNQEAMQSRQVSTQTSIAIDQLKQHLRELADMPSAGAPGGAPGAAPTADAPGGAPSVSTGEAGNPVDASGGGTSPQEGAAPPPAATDPMPKQASFSSWLARQKRA